MSLFKMSADYVYPWPVEVLAPSRTAPGTYDVVDVFTANFRFIPDDEAAKLDAAFAALPDGDKAPRRYYALETALVGWSLGEFTPAARDEAIRHVYYGPAILRAWHASQRPDTGVRTGN